MSDESIEREQIEAVEKLEECLGLNRGFFASLRDEDDWSFVVKTHALIESSLTTLLATRMNNPALESHVFSLDFSGSRHSKLALARGLDLIDADVHKFISGLSKTRNRFVHAVKFSTLTLTEYIDQLNSDERNEFCGSITTLYFEATAPTNRIKEFRDDILKRPKARLWQAALHVIALLSIGLDIVRLDLENDRLQREVLEAEVVHLKTLTGKL